jgi:uncharacterized phage protein (TIGR02218 family)
MKTLSAGLTTHLTQEVTTLATCWKCTLRDTTVLGFTDHHEDLLISGVTYQAASGFTPSAIQTTNGLEVDNLNVQGVLVGGAVTAADLRAGRWDFAAIEIFEVNYKDLTQGTNPLRKGTLGEVSMGKYQFEAELVGVMQKLHQRIGRLFTAPCGNDLGDTRCGVDLGTFPDGTVNSTVTSVTSRRIFADSALTQPTGWFDGGVVTFTSGANIGYAREVKTFNATGDVVTLHEEFPYTIVAGDAYTIIAGCLKRYNEDCGTKFDNKPRFGGFPHLPGIDRMVSGK